MTKAKKIGFVQPSAKETRKTEQDKPKNGVLFASCFCLLILILVTYAYSMTEQYAFNDLLNYSALNSVKEKSNFWLRLFLTGMSSPFSQQWLKATYAWDIGSIGYAPGWSHAVNVCLHILSCLYFYFFMFRLCWRLNVEGKTKIDPYYLAFAATALLACHPLTTGSIAYISGRSGVLGAANYFLALNFFLYGFFEEKLERAFGGYFFFFLFTAIGIASNMQCFTLPFAAFALTLIVKPPDVSIKEWLTERWYEMALFLLAGIGLSCLFMLSIPAQVDSGFALYALSPQVYWATQLKLVVMYYLRCALIPFALSVYPPYVATAAWSDPATIAGAITLLVIGVIGFVQKQPLIQFAIVLFLVNLLPWTILVQSEIAADSRFYLSLSGLCLAAGVGIAHLAARDFRKTVVGFGILLLAFVSLSIWRETEWSNNKRLWQAEIKRDPNNSRAHAYLGSDYLDNKKDGQAKVELEKALKLNPDDFVALAVNGFFRYKDNDFKNAIPQLALAIKQGSKLKMSEEELAHYHSFLAKAYANTGDLDSAYREAELAKRYITADPLLYLIIGKKQLQQQQTLVALKTLEDGLKLEPTNPNFLEPIAQAALDSGFAQVLQHAYVTSARAIKVTHSLLAYQLYVRACLEQGKLKEAHQALELLNKTQGKDADVIWLNFGYEKLAGNQVQAEKLRKQALALDPTLDKRVKFYLRTKPSANLETPAVVPGKTKANPPDTDSSKTKATQSDAGANNPQSAQSEKGPSKSEAMPKGLEQD